jgi:hypothetical protein
MAGCHCQTLPQRDTGSQVKTGCAAPKITRKRQDNIPISLRYQVMIDVLIRVHFKFHIGKPAHSGSTP